MKTILFLTGLTTFITLTSCTPTRKHMREADAQLLQSEQKMLAGEWTGAITQAEQAGEAVKLGIEARPVRKGADGKELDMSPLFEAWAKGPHLELLTALRDSQAERAAAAFVATRQQCTSCHIAAGRNDIPLSTL